MLKPFSKSEERLSSFPQGATKDCLNCAEVSEELRSNFVVTPLLAPLELHVQDSGCTSKAAVTLLDLIPASDSQVGAAAVQSAPVLVLSQTPLITEVSDCAFSSHEPDIVECPFVGPATKKLVPKTALPLIMI